MTFSAIITDGNLKIIFEYERGKSDLNLIYYFFILDSYSLRYSDFNKKSIFENSQKNGQKWPIGLAE